LKVCRDAQEKLRALIKERQLTIEANPSSNRIIGPMNAFEDHPVFQLTLDGDHELSQELRITINSDNPGVFSTSLAHEYYLLGEILLERGQSEVQVNHWLDWLRKNGEYTSFLNTRPQKEEAKIQKLLDSLLKYNQHKPFFRSLTGRRNACVEVLKRMERRRSP
jgi:hypothetical protein